MLTAKGQTPKTIYYMIPFIWNSRKNKTYEKVNSDCHGIRITNMTVLMVTQLYTFVNLYCTLKIVNLSYVNYKNYLKCVIYMSFA